MFSDSSNIVAGIKAASDYWAVFYLKFSLGGIFYGYNNLLSEWAEHIALYTYLPLHL